MATPFVQGRLRKRKLSVKTVTECVHCKSALHIEVDSELRVQVEEADAEPLVFEPQVDWKSFDEPNIIHT